MKIWTQFESYCEETSDSEMRAFLTNFNTLFVQGASQEEGRTLRGLPYQWTRHVPLLSRYVRYYCSNTFKP